MRQRHDVIFYFFLSTGKGCSHLTFAFAFASPSTFNIASMVTQRQTHRMGLNPFLTFYIDAVLNVDANVKCEHTLSIVFM